jgi:glutaredoxin
MHAVRPLLAAGLVLAIVAAQPALAQQVYRIQGPDGRVTFTDQKPLDSSSASAAPAPAVGIDSPAGPPLPFELRQVASRYPVTLYTAPNCAPCDSGRAMLVARGIPFGERSVSTAEDIETLQRISGGASLPFVTLGGQQIKGYSEPEWAQFLDAAGYPRSSQLPAGFRYPPATPLVAAQAPGRTTAAAAPAAAPATAAQAPVPAAAPAAVAPGQNPAGIRF